MVHFDPILFLKIHHTTYNNLDSKLHMPLAVDEEEEEENHDLIIVLLVLENLFGNCFIIPSAIESDITIAC